jgi:Galactose oxidase, central domain
MIIQCRTSALTALALTLVAVPGAEAGNPGGGVAPPSPTYPAARHLQSMGGNQAGLATSGRVYMFGGDSVSGTAMNDLWYFSVPSGQWTMLRPASRTQSLYGRKLASLTCGNGQCVLFGGVSTKVYNEAWYFTEPTGTGTTVTWSKVSCSKAAPCPSPRFAPLTAYDSTRHYHVSFGGSANSDSNNASLADTWTLAGSRWTRRQPQHSPPARTDGSATFVSGIINKVVIFGGDSWPNAPYPQPLCDLWAWDGSDWQAISATGTGPCLTGAAMGWDGARLVVTGGFKDWYSTANTDTWNFTFSSSNAGEWIKASTACALLSGARGAYDPANGKFVFFGGHAGGTTYDSTLVCP